MTSKDGDRTVSGVEAETSGRDSGAGAEAKSRKRRERSSMREELAKFDRGPRVDLKSIKDKKVKGQMKYRERLYKEARHQAAKVGQWLLPAEAGVLEAEGMERTYRFKQDAIVEAVEEGAARKVVDLKLPDLGPYNVDFTRSGRFAALAGRKGHLALLDWQRPRLYCEVQVRETCRDVTFLHNEQFFAVAQKKYAYIYDKRGLEVHCLKETVEPYRLDFLPHHFLLVSTGAAGVLTYQDTSTGQIVAQHRTRLGPCDVLRQNPHNAVMCLGHSNGTVTMWTPNMTSPVVRMLCHKGPVRALAVNSGGHYLVTAGLDCQVKVWDVRTYQEVHAYFSSAPADSIDLSQRNLLAVGWGRRVQVWRGALTAKQDSPYMSHQVETGSIRDLRFVPYEDVLGIGHAGGFSTILVPGAGEANNDSWVADPFQAPKQRREAEVRALLDKLPPSMITVDPDAVGRVIKAPLEVQKERAREAKEANEAAAQKQRDKNESKDKMKGKNKPTRRHRKKQENVIRDRNQEIREKLRLEGKATGPRAEAAAKATKEAEAKRAEKRTRVERALDGVPKPLHGIFRNSLQKLV